MKQRKSKYIKTYSEISKMTRKELESFVKLGSKQANNRLLQIESTGKQNFSDVYNDTMNKINVVNKGKNKKRISSAVKGKNLKELRNIANTISNTLENLETRKELEKKYEKDIEEVFREPRQTKEFIEKVNGNKLLLLDIMNRKMSFFYDVIGSDEVNKIMDDEELNTTQRYERLLITISDELDRMVESEKDDFISEWIDIID